MAGKRQTALGRMLEDYAQRVKQDFEQSGQRAGQGLGEVIEQGNVLTGIPRVVLGGSGAISAPISAALSPILGPLFAPVAQATDTYVGQPVERLTGYPADITNELVMSAAPFGIAKALKPAAPMLSRLADQVESRANQAGYTFRRPEGTLFTFGGPAALTADKVKLAQAKKMAADGLSRDDIWQQTGWFQGIDGNWRFEIDDSNFNLRPNIIEKHKNSNIGSTLTMPLTDAIDAPNLLSAYNLSDTTLDLSRLSKGGIGGFDRANNSIEIMAAPEADLMRRALLHEIQHLIQQKEGFTGGGDPSKLGADKYKRLAGEVEARNVETRRNFTPEQRIAITPWATQDVPFLSQHLTTAQQGLQRSGGGPVKLADDVADDTIAPMEAKKPFDLDSTNEGAKVSRLNAADKKRLAAIEKQLSDIEPSYTALQKPYQQALQAHNEGRPTGMSRFAWQSQFKPPEAVAGFQTIAAERARLTQQRQSLTDRISTRDRMADVRAAAELYADKVATMHQNANLNFKAMSVDEYNAAPAVKIYKSPNYGGRQSSEYKVIMVGGRPAYARKSNHWGQFGSNIKDPDQAANYLGITREEALRLAGDDPFGRIARKNLNWQLEGGKADARTSQAGYVFLDE